MSEIWKVLEFSFFQNAILTSILTAVVCGITGTYIVSRRIVFVSGGITHASFAGLGLGVYLGIHPIFTAGIAAIVAALGLSGVKKMEDIREDSAIASVWALGMAIGVLFLTLTPGYTSGLSSYLFGNILLVSRVDLYSIGIFALLLVLIFSLFYRPILYSMFDEDFAETRRLRARRWNMFALILVAISLVLSIRLVGIMLLMSLLSLPQTIMTMFSSSLKMIVVGSILISLVANLLGLMLSYYWIPIPSGVSIVLILFIFFVIAKGVYRVRHRNAFPK